MNEVGKFTVKGSAFEDIITILGRNGYATEVWTPIQESTNPNEITHVIRVYESEVENGRK